jgi:hypothetical protein
MVTTLTVTYSFDDSSANIAAPHQLRRVTLFGYPINRNTERTTTNMSNIHLPRFSNRTAVGVWVGVGFLGGATALVAVLAMAASRGFLPIEISFGADRIGSVFMAFIAGVSLDCLALWGIYSSGIATSEGDFQN